MSEFARELTELVHGLARDAAAHADGQLEWLWTQVCELGLAGIGIAEQDGGSGGSLTDLMVVVRELARVGLATPIVEASTAAYALGQAPTDGFATIAVDRDLIVPNGALTAEFFGVRFVDAATSLVVVMDASVVTIPLRQRAVTVESERDIAELPCGTVRLDSSSFAYVPAAPAAGKVLDRLALARSAALLGSVRGAYELTRSYLVERHQFGAPLIKIPAVSTALAQMAVRIRFAESAFDRALTLCAATDTPAAQRSGAAAAARIAAADVATMVARSAHQLHGAVGFTDEYGLHRYTTRLWAWRDADEPERAHCARLGARVRAEGETALWQRISA